MSDFLVTRAVDFYEVHRLVTPILDQFESWPTAGTLPWRELTDTDPAKWASILDVARYGALQMQLRHESLAQASRDISAATDWTAIARSHLRHSAALASGLYIPRRIAS